MYAPHGLGMGLAWAWHGLGMGLAWARMGSHGPAWARMGSHGLGMGPHGLAWMGPHGPAWARMGVFLLGPWRSLEPEGPIARGARQPLRAPH
jgi:hypothetical protein